MRETSAIILQEVKDRKQASVINRKTDEDRVWFELLQLKGQLYFNVIMSGSLWYQRRLRRSDALSESRFDLCVGYESVDGKVYRCTSHLELQRVSRLKPVYDAGWNESSEGLPEYDHLNQNDY